MRVCRAIGWGAPRRRRSALLGVLAQAALGCARFGYEWPERLEGSGAGGARPVGPLARPHPASGELDAAAGGSAGGPTAPAPVDSGAQSAAVADAAAASASQDGGSAGSGGGGAGDAGAAGAGGGATTGVCVLAGGEAVVHGFDSGTDGAVAVGAGSPELSWNATQGSPGPGCIDFRSVSGAGAEVRYDGALGDLRGRRISVNARGLVGADVRLRLFLESGPGRERAWGDSMPAPAGWGCLTLDLAAPALVQAAFDAADVRAMGVEIEGSGAIRCLLDQVAY